MADYNTFVVQECSSRHILMVTSSARKALTFLKKGVRIEVWNDNQFANVVYESTRKRNPKVLVQYVSAEAQYIARKQARAEKRNKARRKEKQKSEIT